MIFDDGGGGEIKNGKSKRKFFILFSIYAKIIYFPINDLFPNKSLIFPIPRKKLDKILLLKKIIY